jgi:integrase/recombinase XerD
MENLEIFKQKLLLKNMSERTIMAYVSVLNLTAKRLNLEINSITESDLVGYIISGKKRKMSSSTQMMVINAFKAYFKEVYGKKFDHDILPRPKVEQKQPDILSVEEIQSVINSISNIKHKSIVALMYSAALRVSEAINLKIKDIDSKNNKINIKNSKGKIDRVVMLDDSILKLLREYWGQYRTNEYIFEGARGSKYSTTSVQNIVKRAVKNIGIHKKISSHSLRHSCLTQLIKNGVDLRTVQKIAGHKNINTTAGYIKIIDSDILKTDSPIKLINL